jgi:hypothetical protein
MKMLFQRLDIYRRLQGKKEVVVYRCLRLLSGEGYVVQSADWIRFPVATGIHQEHEVRFVELLCEEAPEARSTPFGTIEEAIQAFDKEFENVWQ